MAVSRHSWIVKLALLKKLLFALVLLAASVVSGFTWRNEALVTAWADQHLVTAEFGLTRWIFHFLTQASVPELKLIARLSGAYGLLILLAAWAVWQEKRWGYWLFAGLVGVLLPIEIRELIQEISAEVGLLFGLNLAIFGYFLWEAWHFVTPTPGLELHQRDPSDISS